VLEPLTIGLLERNGLGPGDVRWHVRVSNHKVFRRTGNSSDKIDAELDTFSDHLAHALRGRSPNFWTGRFVPFGHVRYVRPTTAFPEIRLRFTPAEGRVYGASKFQPLRGKPRDQNLSAVVYNSNRGAWAGYRDIDDEIETTPNDTYRQARAGDPEVRTGRSLGYIDDECDGIVHVELGERRKLLTSYARIVAGPPAFAPDSFPIRTAMDELEQAMFGPDAAPEEATLARVEEILRRAVDTVRLMNTVELNGIPQSGGGTDGGGMVVFNTGSGRADEPIMAPALVDNRALIQLHRSILTALQSGTAPWFVDVLRRYDEVGDLSDRGRRKMPAMMRGAEGQYLALTRRQYDIISRVARGVAFAPHAETSPGRKTATRRRAR
jgi:hypothetical protein